ncbi:hypothetical protein [Ensifer sp. ZNC0028]|uniref:hypothetical protein n=1 Tax=Ensifer sp. ZNC0028 TaxID=1339236 RepID=UPI0005BA0A4F|nr:hypothetical protein [Ensifer sp. ZNC0028]
MTSKIDVRVILSDHFNTFRDEASGNYSYFDFVIMLGLPLVLSIAAAAMQLHIRDEYVSTLISAFAIFAGLLFNVLVLIYSVSGDGKEKDEIRDRLVAQSFSNISFSVMSSLIAVMFLSLLLFVNGIYQSVVEACVYFICLNFLLTMLMVLKRIHVLLRERFSS